MKGSPQHSRQSPPPSYLPIANGEGAPQSTSSSATSSLVEDEDEGVPSPTACDMSNGSCSSEDSTMRTPSEGQLDVSTTSPASPAPTQESSDCSWKAGNLAFPQPPLANGAPALAHNHLLTDDCQDCSAVESGDVESDEVSPEVYIQDQEDTKDEHQGNGMVADPTIDHRVPSPLPQSPDPVLVETVEEGDEISPPCSPTSSSSHSACDTASDDSGSQQRLHRPAPQPWVPANCANYTLHQEILWFTELLRLTKHERHTRSRMIQKIKTEITKKWRDAKVKDYGSFAYGLSLPHGDVDLSVHGVPLKAHVGLDEAGKHLGRCAISCRLIRARVPVLKLRDRILGIEGDLTWCSPDAKIDAAASVPTVQELLSQYPAAPPLILVVKMLLKQHALHETREWGGLSSIAVTLLVIAFLKVHVQVGPEWPVHKPPWHTECYCENPADLGDLLLDFFVFYGEHFPYMEKFVSVHPVPKYGLFPPLKPEDSRIIVPKDCGALFDHHGLTRVLVVQDPVMATNNLAAVCRETSLILKLFTDLFKALQHQRKKNSGASLLNVVVSADEALWERRQLLDLLYVQGEDPYGNPARSPLQYWGHRLCTRHLTQPLRSPGQMQAMDEELVHQGHPVEPPPFAAASPYSPWPHGYGFGTMEAVPYYPQRMPDQQHLYLQPLPVAGHPFPYHCVYAPGLEGTVPPPPPPPPPGPPPPPPPPTYGLPPGGTPAAVTDPSSSCANGSLSARSTDQPPPTPSPPAEPAPKSNAKYVAPGTGFRTGKQGKLHAGNGNKPDGLYRAPRASSASNGNSGGVANPAEDEASRQYQQKYSQYTPQMVAAPYGHLVPVYSAAPTAVTYPGLYPTLATTEAQPMQHPVQFQQVQYSIATPQQLAALYGQAPVPVSPLTGAVDAGSGTGWAVCDVDAATRPAPAAGGAAQHRELSPGIENRVAELRESQGTSNQPDHPDHHPKPKPTAKQLARQLKRQQREAQAAGLDMAADAQLAAAATTTMVTPEQLHYHQLLLAQQQAYAEQLHQQQLQLQLQQQQLQQQQQQQPQQQQQLVSNGKVPSAMGAKAGDLYHGASTNAHTGQRYQRPFGTPREFVPGARPKALKGQLKGLKQYRPYAPVAVDEREAETPTHDAEPDANGGPAAIPSDPPSATPPPPSDSTAAEPAEAEARTAAEKQRWDLQQQLQTQLQLLQQRQQLQQQQQLLLQEEGGGGAAYYPLTAAAAGGVAAAAALQYAMEGPRFSRRLSAARPGKQPGGPGGPAEEAWQGGAHWQGAAEPSVDQPNTDEGSQPDPSPSRYDALHPNNMRAMKPKVLGKTARLADPQAGGPFAQRPGMGKAQRRQAQQGPHGAGVAAGGLGQVQLRRAQLQALHQHNQQLNHQQQQAAGPAAAPAATTSGAAAPAPASSSGPPLYPPVAGDPYQPTYHQHQPYMPLGDYPSPVPAPPLTPQPDQWASGEADRYQALPDAAAGPNPSPLPSRAAYAEDYGWREGSVPAQLPPAPRDPTYYDGTVAGQPPLADTYYVVAPAAEPHDTETPSAVQRLAHRPKRPGPPKGRLVKASQMAGAIPGDASQTPSSGGSNTVPQADVHNLGAMQVMYYDGAATSTAVMQPDGHCGWVEHSWNGSDPNSGPLTHSYVVSGPLPVPPNGS